MMRVLIPTCILVLCSTLTFVTYAKEALTETDAQIARALIEQSIEGYPGNCPCPYNQARNGSRCGKRSAYNRGGGYAPLCFNEDVSAEDIAEYRRIHQAKTKD